MTITHIFFDIGGVLATNGWDDEQRALAAQRFQLDAADFTQRRREASGMLEEGRMTLDEYLDVTVFDTPRAFTRAEFKSFMRAQSEPFPGTMHQIFRIDHYLGKEAVQNLLVFRFANSIFEPVWNRDHIHHVQITAAESVGVEHRAAYYDDAGVVRDMFQNHLLQLLALTAMEPPVAFRADAVRAEKVKVLDAIRPLLLDEVDRYVVAGQYGAGQVGKESVIGYREEDGVPPQSTTPTYAAVRLLMDNWRWQGVPFLLRSGKRMARRVTEIAIRFRQPPHLMFPLAPEQAIAPNVLTFRIQPDEGISLCFEVKVPDHDFRMATANMDFSYARGFGPSSHSAYETLLMDCMLGDATLFTRSDGVEAAWRVIDSIATAAEQSLAARFPNYSAGEWGPAEADALIALDGARWRKP